MVTAGLCASTLAFVFAIMQPEAGLVLLVPAGLLLLVGDWPSPRRTWRDWIAPACAVSYVILGLIVVSRL